MDTQGKAIYETPAMMVVEVHLQTRMLTGSPNTNQATIPGYGNAYELP